VLSPPYFIRKGKNVNYEASREYDHLSFSYSIFLKYFDLNEERKKYKVLGGGVGS
jgi:hypothetical protein